MKLVIENLKKHYGGISVFDSLSCSFEPGCYAIVGRNGVGKSTLLEIIAGVEKYQSGNISLDDKCISNHEFWYKKRMGYAPDRLIFYPFLTVRDFFRLVSSIKNASPLDQNHALIKGFALSEHLDKTLNSLSLGTQKKLLLAAALLGGPDILLLDEPSDELDKSSKIFLIEIINKRRNLITLISTHDDCFLNKLKVKTVNLD